MNSVDRPGLVWQLTAETREPKDPIHVAVGCGAVTIGPIAADDTDSAHAVADVAQLAQTNLWVADVDLLFREDASTLTLLALRFPSAAGALAFLTSVLTEFEQATGTRFATNAICSIRPGPR